MKRAFLFVLAAGATSIFGASCEDLGKLALKGGTVTLAQSVEAGAFAPPQAGGAAKGNNNAFKALPAFCRVAATLRPSSDSEIKIEVWMPASGWNNDLQSVGNGAWAGTIGYPAMATALSSGFATASTDTGHAGGAGDFMVGHPEKFVDFGYRAVHEMTVAAKAVTAAFYGKAPAKSYFNGCSTGGRQALMEAQRFPEDYDGILAGAPAIYGSRLQGFQVWLWNMSHQADSAPLPAAKNTMVHQAALAACDALDGVKDGVIENPLRCKFDVSALQCKGADEPTCLTAAEVVTARGMYAGLPGSNGSTLFKGLEAGSEQGWNMMTGPRVNSLADELYRNVVKKDDPSWNSKSLSATDVAAAERQLKDVMDATNPDLSPFVKRGGKLVIYHGWADPGIPPQNTLDYYGRVRQALGSAPGAGADSVRLFMVPGMGHCQGGDGTDKFDGMAALKAWAEAGTAPARIEASHQTQGRVDKTRPLCAYPAEAVYNGSGSTNESANFTCKVR